MPREKRRTKDNRVQYFDLDFSRIGLGRVTKSARTRDIDVYHKRKGILDTLRNAGRLDILKAFVDDQISIEELHHLNEQQKLFEAMELVLFKKNLWLAFDDTIDRMGASPLTRARYQTSITKLMRVGDTDAFRKHLGPGATIGDLEKVDWDELKKAWGGSPADWNHLHRMLSHFLSKLVGKKSQHRYRILELIPRKKESARIVMLTVATFYRIRDALPERLRAVAMTLLLTGMRRTEYLAAGKTHLLPDVFGVMIPQTEADSSTEPVYVHPDLWHWIDAAIPSPLRYKQLRIHWKRACAEAGVPGFRFHDLRHALGQWAIEAGAPVNEVMAALRHDKLETTAIYLRTVAKKNVANVVGEIVIATDKSPRPRKRSGARGRGGRKPATARRTASARRTAAARSKAAPSRRKARKKSVGRG